VERNDALYEKSHCLLDRRTKLVAIGVDVLGGAGDTYDFFAMNFAAPSPAFAFDLAPITLAGDEIIEHAAYQNGKFIACNDHDTKVVLK